MTSCRLWISLVVVFLLAVPAAYGGDAGWDAFGFQAGRGGARTKESYSRYEIFANYNLPWTWDLKSQWRAGTYVGINVGSINSKDAALLASAGPGVYIETPSRRVRVSAGFFPTYISRSEFGADDFGGPLQFTSSLGIDIYLFHHLSLGYKFQHMSNAGIYAENPGINSNLAVLQYRF